MFFCVFLYNGGVENDNPKHKKLIEKYHRLKDKEKQERELEDNDNPKHQKLIDEYHRLKDEKKKQKEESNKLLDKIDKTYKWPRMGPGVSVETLNRFGFGDYDYEAFYENIKAARCKRGLYRKIINRIKQYIASQNPKSPDEVNQLNIPDIWEIDGNSGPLIVEMARSRIPRAKAEYNRKHFGVLYDRRKISRGEKRLKRLKRKARHSGPRGGLFGKVR